MINVCVQQPCQKGVVTCEYHTFWRFLSYCNCCTQIKLSSILTQKFQDIRLYRAELVGILARYSTDLAQSFYLYFYVLFYVVIYISLRIVYLLSSLFLSYLLYYVCISLFFAPSLYAIRNSINHYIFTYSLKKIE